MSTPGAIASKKYRETHVTECKARSKEYYERNKAKKNEYSKKYHEEHKEEDLQRYHIYYEENKEVIAEKQKEIRKINQYVCACGKRVCKYDLKKHEKTIFHNLTVNPIGLKIMMPPNFPCQIIKQNKAQFHCRNEVGELMKFPKGQVFSDAKLA